MTLTKNLKFPISLFLDKMGIEIMFDEHQVKKTSPPRQILLILHSCYTKTFFKV